MKATLFLQEARDTVAQTIGQRGGKLPVHTVEDAQAPTAIKPPGGL